MATNNFLFDAYKAAREDAEIHIDEAASFVQGQLGMRATTSAELCDGYERRFWETIASLAAAKIGKHLADAPPAQMTDGQACAFAATGMPFGRYEGDLIRDIPDSYWHWLQYGEWSTQLRQYLNSPYYQNKTS